MVSALDRAKRALVSLLRALAVTYTVNLEVTRDSTDAGVTSAYPLLLHAADAILAGKS